MTYFQRFPQLEYDGNIIKDISRRVNIPKIVRDRAGAFTNYTVKDGERIEDVAYSVYGDPTRHWVIMLMNNMVDPFYDWVLSTEELTKYIADNYTDPNAIHHWVSNGQIVESSIPGAVSISNTQHEDIINESKRKIKILRSDYIQEIEEELYKVSL